MHSFAQLRKEYRVFEFSRYEYCYTPEGLEVKFYYNIPSLEEFTTRWVFPAAEKKDDGILKRLLFSLGMVEGISYYKCTCPPELHIAAGGLTPDQEEWWRRLYFNGLGEFLYINDIAVKTPHDLLPVIDAHGEREYEALHDTAEYSGVLVPVGGGKDSAVSLELLKGEDITAYTVNVSRAEEECIKQCSHCSGHINVRRILDKKILEMNSRGYLNGHIPFSAVLAFSAVITAYLNGIRYIALSNENSANESTVKDSGVNHQYSKSFEFETLFTDYIKRLTDSDIHYFSLLRPLSELQIAYIFSGLKKYHGVFRSCNAGSKQGIWCCSCPKCMFVYIILSPFLSEQELVGIFGQNLLDREDMDKYFCELCGIDENKPFECVGTRAEVMACLGEVVKRGEKYLLTQRHREYIESNAPLLSPMLAEYNGENLVPDKFADRVRAALGMAQDGDVFYNC